MERHLGRRVRELVANRTTLLAGISHDLRTPMTQIQLALAMLPDEGGDAELMTGIRRDLENMNRLIAQFLESGFNLAGSLGFVAGPLAGGSLVTLLGSEGAPAYPAAFLVVGGLEVLCALAFLPLLGRFRT
jgi:two-component system osmolarity sensor histidine kinase EnvZ